MHRIVDDGKVIRITGTGFYAEEDVIRHFETLSIIVARRRQAGRQVKALADLRNAATQSATVAKIITDATNRIYTGATDRVAIVTSSMLLKLQLERVHRQQGFGVFLTLDEAERYLEAATARVDA